MMKTSPNRRLFVIFAFTVVAFLILGIRIQVQQSELEKTQRKSDSEQYDQCVISRSNAQALDDTLDRIITSLQESDRPDADEVIDIYEGIRPGIPTCTRP